MFSNLLNYSLILEIFAYILSAIILATLIVSSTHMAVFLTFVLFILFFILKDPLKALSILIIAIPFSGITIFRTNLINLPGTKPLQLLALLVLFIVLINNKKAAKMSSYTMCFTVAIMAIFSISIVRSMPHLDLITYYSGVKLSPIGYILSDYVKPLIYFIPFIVIIKFVKKNNHLEYLANVLVLSITILSVYVIYSTLFIIRDIGSLGHVRDYYASVLGMHGNAVANFYIIGIPILLSRYFTKKDILSILSICLAIVALGFLYSRTAYLTTLLAFLLYLVISKRAKFLPVLLAIVFGLSFIISSSIIQRASKGVNSGDMDEIAAGRVEGMWLPLIDEYTHNYKKLILGNGRYAIMTSVVAKRGILDTTATHPHNMYLEQILDAGLIGLGVFMLFYIILLRKLFTGLRNINDYKIKEYQYAVIVSLISYLISGLTERSFFPTHENGFLFIIVGIAIVIIRMSQDSGRYIDVKT